MCNRYQVKYATNMDGVPLWDKVEAVQINRHLWLPEIDITGFARLCYDSSNLYVRLEAIEKEIVATYTGNYDMVCEDSCLEFFLCPVSDDLRYFNFELNPNGAFYFGFGYNNDENIRLFIEGGTHLFRINPFVSEDGWGVEFRIPVSFLQTFMPTFELRSGLKLKGNFYKCGDHTKRPHYIAWNEVKAELPDFHKPEYFGKLILE